MRSSPVSGSRMRRFWNRRAREDPFYFVDNNQSYRGTDSDRFWAEGRIALDKMLDAAGKTVRSTDSVVDIGCGIGRLTRPLAARASEVWAVDVSEHMLDLAKEQNPGLDNVHWLHGDGNSLTGIEDARVDGIVSLVVFQHIPDPAVVMSYVREMGRVLKPGGWAAFHVSNDPAVHRSPPAGARIRGLLSRRGPGGQADAAWLGSAVDIAQLRSVAADSGLEIDRIEGERTQFCLVGAHRA